MLIECFFFAGKKKTEKETFFELLRDQGKELKKANTEMLTLMKGYFGMKMAEMEEAKKDREAKKQEAKKQDD